MAASGDPSSSRIPHTKKISLNERSIVHVQGESHVGATTIDMLSDDVLLEIFDSYRKIHIHELFELEWSWHLLVHVCRRWRRLIFESPRRLNLQILCTRKTPVKDSLFIWPTLPIFILYRNIGRNAWTEGVDNVIAALQHTNRVCHVDLSVTNSVLDKIVPFMLEPFPELTNIEISFEPTTDGGIGALPNGFLGGCAHRLQEIYFHSLSFPSLPMFLFSAGNLISLTVLDIPPTGYIAPEAMVACLAALHRLKILAFGFETATSSPDRISPPPVTRNVLPSLTSFTFNGPGQYLEDLVAWIDSPQLETICVDCQDSLVDISVVQLPKFVDRTIGRKLTEFRHAQICYSSGSFAFAIMNNPVFRPFWSGLFIPHFNMRARTVFSCEGIGWQVSDIAQVLSQFSFATHSNVIHLELSADAIEGKGFNETTNLEWLNLLRQFPVTETLYVSSGVSVYVALALEDITEDIVTEVLPSLELICLDARAVPMSVDNFVSARRLAGRPVTVVGTTEEFDDILESYYLTK